MWLYLSGHGFYLRECKILFVYILGARNIQIKPWGGKAECIWGRECMLVCLRVTWETVRYVEASL